MSDNSYRKLYLKILVYAPLIGGALPVVWSILSMEAEFVEKMTFFNTTLILLVFVFFSVELFMDKLFHSWDVIGSSE
jgi:hypothetical protein